MDFEEVHFSLSEVILYKNFDPNNNYKIYLYSYVQDFSEIKAECFVYHYQDGGNKFTKPIMTDPSNRVCNNFLIFFIIIRS